MPERLSVYDERFVWANTLADLIEDYRDQYIREQEQELPRAIAVIIQLLREGDVTSARNLFWSESVGISQFPEIYEFLVEEFVKGGEYLMAVFHGEGGISLGNMQVRNRPKLVKWELQGSIPKGTVSIELMGEESEVVMRLVYGLRAEIEALFAEKGEPSPIDDNGYFEGAPGLRFIVEESGHNGFEVDVPVPYDFGDNVFVEELAAPPELIPRQKKLLDGGYRRAAILASEGEGREDDYIYFMRCIQEAYHLNEKVVVLGLDDYFELFIRSDREGFCLPSTFND